VADLQPQSVRDQQLASAPRPTDALLGVWNERRKQGLAERRKYEPTWMVCQSFVANRQWVGWVPGSSASGRIVPLANPGNRERHTVNVCTQYLTTVIGKLFSDDFLPNLLFRREDIESEQYALHAQRALKFCWDEEISADEQILEMLNKMGTYGTAALRCFWDPTRGHDLGDMPIGPDGQPITGMAEAQQYVAQAQMMGQQVPFKSVREGRIVWEPLSPFNMIVAPGIDHERYFPWLIIERPYHLEQIRNLWGNVPGLKEQSLSGIDSGSGARDLPQQTNNAAPGSSSPSKLKEHAVVTTGFEQPSAQYPDGRTVTWIGGTNVVLDQRDELPYLLNGEPHHGVVFFKYHRVDGRFWAVGVVEPLLGPQRQRNRARSQMIEMKDRNLGRVYAHKGTLSISNQPSGKIMEVVEVPLGHQLPQETAGVPPGPWIENEARMNDEDMDRVAGLREVSMGQAPAGVSAYSAMALLAEQDDRRVGPILKQIRVGVADSVRLTLHDIRRYWPIDKQIALAGPQGQVEQFIFNASKLPAEILIDIPPGAARPRSQAAEIQKIFDLFDRSISSGRPLPLTWLKESIDAGKALPIPRDIEAMQRSKAELENILISQGQIIQPDYFDDDMIHIEVHREAEISARMMNNEQEMQALEYHIQLHSESMNAKQSGVGGPGAPMGQPGAMGSTPGQPGMQSQVPQQQGANGASGGRPMQYANRMSPLPPATRAGS
jgi:hypothetical protein